MILLSQTVTAEIAKSLTGNPTTDAIAMWFIAAAIPTLMAGFWGYIKIGVEKAKSVGLTIVIKQIVSVIAGAIRTDLLEVLKAEGITDRQANKIADTFQNRVERHIEARNTLAGTEDILNPIVQEVKAIKAAATDSGTKTTNDSGRTRIGIIAAFGLFAWLSIVACPSIPTPDPDHGVSNASYPLAITRSLTNIKNLYMRLQTAEATDLAAPTPVHSKSWWESQLGVVSATADLLDAALKGSTYGSAPVKPTEVNTGAAPSGSALSTEPAHEAIKHEVIR